ncbi:type III PLP-dependent enzyme [Sphingobium amiense]|uniref:ornithine decarboxylase n=1 Tax=Sphingobium amiense TaxID=135719 RepID=A0A494WA02_9SPHN|nr:type III PLP-dependent enzyme [Sphingobium amiense]BBD97265.1 type III PLP-dependent enzyme [Sphingobium amiense]
MHKHHSALGVATALKPAAPVTLIRPDAAARAARFFVEKFPGRSLYAVKANPSPDLIRTLYAAGITHFDVASIAEVRLVADSLAAMGAQAKLCFMHPVKAEEAIAEAYHRYGVRTFSLDSMDELEKIMRATGDATDLELCVRLRVSSEHSELSLASKFGAEPGETRELLMATRQAADALGICFHVGSQAMSPQAYSDAIERVRAAIVEAAVTVDIIDVGGGFPSVYPGMEPVALEHYFEAIHRGFESLPVSYSSELWCEPGRALSAEYSSVVVRVERRRGNELYINDGAYGALFDAAHLGWRFPVELLRDEAGIEPMEGFAFYGPTCDDMDHMVGPFMLPADVQAGDYIEIGMLGAYGAAMRTGFNGFTSDATIEVEDEPMASLYTESVTPRRRATIIKLGK